MGEYHDSMVNYKTLILGASANNERYSFKAVISLFNAGIDVIPMGIKEGKITNIKIVAPFTVLKDIHTISLYLSPQKHLRACPHVRRRKGEWTKASTFS